MSTNGPYGVTIGLNEGAGAPAPYANWTALLADMAALNLTWLRFQLSWKNIEVTQGNYTWTALDDAVQHCNSAGINLMYTIRGAPTWAFTTASQQATDETGSNGPGGVGFYLMDPTLTAGFVTQVCQRYQTSIQALGWNEDFNIHSTSNNSGFHGIKASPYSGLYGTGGAITTGNKVQPGRDPQYFVPVLKAVSPIVRQYMPGVPFGMACMWWVQPVNGSIPNTPVSNYTAFLGGLYAGGCLGLFDFVDFHYYTNTINPVTGNNQTSTFAQALADIKAATAAGGEPNKPIWLTEFGWQVTADVPDLATQTARYNQIYHLAGQNNLAKVFFFTLDESASPVTSSLVNNGVPQQPTYGYVAGFTGGNPSGGGKVGGFSIHA